MKLKLFEIYNFRSIVNTTCNVSDQITLLAGKNESGKTNILTALTKLNDGEQFTKRDKTSGKPDEEAIVVRFIFQLSEKEIIEFTKDLAKVRGILSNEVIFDVDNIDGIHVEGKFIEDFENNAILLTNEIRLELDKKINECNEYIVSNALDFSEIDLISEKNLFEKFNELTEIAKKIPRTPENQSQHPTLSNIIREINETIEKLTKKSGVLIDRILEARPKIIMFRTFEDTLPPEVPYGEFIDKNILKTKHSIVNDLAELTDFDVTELSTDDRLSREAITEKASRVTTQKFSKFWKQNPVEFIFRVDDKVVSIFIRDKGKEDVYHPDERSKGFQWYLSFYLRLEAQAREKNNIILIDEPGLYLHAKAQDDVLKELVKVTKENQIIFTTHSPYLIDPDELNRVRLVLKNKRTNYTKILHSFHSGADADTLTPIVTAIGLDLSRNLLFSKKLNVIIEGPSDYYYLRSMIHFLKNNKPKYDFSSEISLTPCMGHTTVGLIISLLTGLGLKYKVILDKKDTIKTINKLKRDVLEENQVITVGSNPNDSIEQMFHEVDRKKYNLLDKNKGKILISREFYEKVLSGEYKTFEPDTLKKFRKLFDEIQKQ